MASSTAGYPPEGYDIDAGLYDWSARVFRVIRKFLRVDIQLRGKDRLGSGDIFVFNHFSRFETFIPQYLIYEATGAFSYAVAAAQFFRDDDLLCRYLSRVGVVPTDHPRLFPLLATQVLKGRKLVIFPEGGMVKDRRVVDSRGHYRIYSQSTGRYRKQHTGPAVLAQGIEAFKAAIRSAYARRQHEVLARWSEDLKLDGIESLLAVAMKPTSIVPGSITFYPIRSSDNWLRQLVELFSQGLSLRQVEELTIEGNILLRDTDMDLCLAPPIIVDDAAFRRPAWLAEGPRQPPVSLDEVFDGFEAPRGLVARLVAHRFKQHAAVIRDRYMADTYRSTTINLSHLASALIMHAVRSGQTSVERGCFLKTLYVAIKNLQACPHINLHRSLLNPEDYEGLLQGRGDRLESFIAMATNSGLLAVEGETLQFSPKVAAEQDRDAIRMENLIAVYANEVAPLPEVGAMLAELREQCDRLTDQALARWCFDDECRALQWGREHRPQPRDATIDAEETATADPTPFLRFPERPGDLGVLLVHGLLASPAELAAYGDYLLGRGYTVLGVRLKGHGTSPRDLQQRSWQDWYASVEGSLRILQAFCSRIVVVGFSTGGALGLLLAAQHPRTVCAAVAVAVPVKFRNPVLMLVPLVAAGNELLSWGSASGGPKPFVINPAEHPHINYRRVPIRALAELRRLIAELERTADAIAQPVLLLHGDADPIVLPDSVEPLLDRLGSPDKQAAFVPAVRHGILMENLGGAWGVIDAFLVARGLVPPTPHCMTES